MSAFRSIKVKKEIARARAQAIKDIKRLNLNKKY